MPGARTLPAGGGFPAGGGLVIASPYLTAATGLAITAAGELVMLAQQAGGGSDAIGAGTPGLWFAVGGIITALGTTIVQPFFKERATQVRLDEAMKRIASLEASRDLEIGEKQKALDRLNRITDRSADIAARNADLTGMLQRVTTAQLVERGRHLPGVAVDLADALMVGDGPRAGRGPRVLLVEDDPVARASVATMLELRDYRVEAVASLADGLAALERQPDFVMLDLMLPDGDGAELLRRVRAEGLPTKVIVTTGKDRGELDAVAALAPLGLLQKPYNLNDIFALLRGKGAA